MPDVITLAHGNGGKLTHELIRDIFAKHFSNDILDQGDDAARLTVPQGRLAFTTDSFVISPLFFRGGDIGKLAVCGTVNDLTACGAKPLYLTCGFIIEEGLLVKELEKVVESMGKTAAKCGVKIVSGDTKVVQKGAADKLFINTSGIGVIAPEVNVSGSNAKPGDKVIITGTVADHGCTILLERENLSIFSDVKSDCAPLAGMLEAVYAETTDIHVMRDPTRGGVATTLNEIAAQSGVCIKLVEDSIPVNVGINGICALLGMDPLYIANEGKMLIIAPEAAADKILKALKQHSYGKDACVIGEVLPGPAGKVIMSTITGGTRVVDMMVADQLPRIC